MPYNISIDLSSSLQIYLYGLHILLSDASGHIQEAMLVRIQNGYRVAFLILLNCRVFLAVRIESHWKLMARPVANVKT